MKKSELREVISECIQELDEAKKAAYLTVTPDQMAKGLVALSKKAKAFDVEKNAQEWKFAQASYASLQEKF